MTQTATRRDLLRIGTSAAAYAAGAAIVTGGVALATQAKGATGASPRLLDLMARYHSADEKYDRLAEQLQPARDRWQDAISAARSSVPHVEMSCDLAGVPHSNGGTRTYTTANNMDVACAAVSAKTKRFADDGYTDGQYRLFALKRRFHEAAQERDAQIAAAVAKAQSENDLRGIAAQEDAAYDVVSACGSDVIEYQPRSLADLSAKLAFYKATAVVPDEALLEHVMADVAALSAYTTQEGR